MRRLGLAALLALAAAAPAAAFGPATNYVIQCQGCHLDDGSGTPGKVPALAGSMAQFLRVPGGRDYLGRVPGVANAQLADADLADLLNWALRRFDGTGVPADFRPYTAGEIHRLRAQPLVDVQSARRALLEALGRAR